LGASKIAPQLVRLLFDGNVFAFEFFDHSYQPSAISAQLNQPFLMADD
jgi:hypothetical protein